MSTRSSETARLTLARWRPGEMPPGPVELWFAVFTDDGELMGAERAARVPRWEWRDGCLSLSYSPGHGHRHPPRVVQHRADLRRLPGTGIFRPLWPVSLGPPQEMRAGDDIYVSDGVISIIPELPGPHGLRLRACVLPQRGSRVRSRWNGAGEPQDVADPELAGRWRDRRLRGEGPRHPVAVKLEQPQEHVGADTRAHGPERDRLQIPGRTRVVEIIVSRPGGVLGERLVQT